MFQLFNRFLSKVIFLSAQQQKVAPYVPFIPEQTRLLPLYLVHLMCNADTENISFQRTKSGLFGWGGERVETVSGMDCKVSKIIMLYFF
jgi:hypothetical protein